MRSEYPFFPQKPMLPLTDQVGYCMQNAPTASLFNFNGMVLPSFYDVDVQYSDACPKNFIIVDQTYKSQSHIMFHPEFPVSASIFQDNVDQYEASRETRVLSSSKEDSADIDALLSMEYEENEQCDDDDEVSTGRTNAIYECNSPDSCSGYESESTVKSMSPLRTRYGSRSNDKKRKRMRKMVNALKGIVPGTDRNMSSVAVLNEAVRYLKSLRVEVQKLEVAKLNGEVQ